MLVARVDETVAVCGVFQLAAVKISDAGDTVPAPVFELESWTVTSAVGGLFNTMVNVAVPPA